MTRLQLSSIAFDAGTQIRTAIDQQLVSDYADAMSGGAVFPPVVVFHDGNQYYLADGFHRYMAAGRNQVSELDVEVKAGTKDDALWFALGANKTNGKRLTDLDKRHAITLALQTWPDRSASLIADQVGCSKMRVSQIRSGLSTALHLPKRVIGRDGRGYPASPSAKDASRIEAAAMFKAGKSTKEVRQATGIGRDTANEIRRNLGLSVDKTPKAVKDRIDAMRTMAEQGHSSRQIAAALGLSVEGCRTTMRRHRVDVPADKAIGPTKRHDSNRILERIVIDAENIMEGFQLVDFSEIDRSRLSEWLTSLTASRDKLGGLIRRLMKEKQNGEAA